VIDEVFISEALLFTIRIHWIKLKTKGNDRMIKELRPDIMVMSSIIVSASPHSSFRSLRNVLSSKSLHLVDLLKREKP